MKQYFLEAIRSVSDERSSRLVLALDISTMVKSEDDVSNLYRKAKWILSEVEKFIVALKVNFQLLLPLGLYGYLQEVVDEAKGYGLVTIMDCKLNDVEHTNRWAAAHFFEVGFDALTANPFAGWDGGLRGLFEEAKMRRKGVILLVYMSHLGAEENYGRKILLSDGKVKPYYMLFAEKAVEWGADGVIVGATRPNVIEEVRRMMPKEVLIFSPGVTVQGGDAIMAFRAGADYIIVGRAIYEAKKPRRAAKQIMEKINKALK